MTGRTLMQGYLIVRGCLDADRLRRMRAAVDAEFTLTKENTRFGFLHLGPDFHNLIDHPKTLPLLREFIGPKLRLDHTYGMGMAADGRGEGENLHHEGVGGSHGIGHGSYYHTHGERIHNGLIVVAFALYDNPAGMGFSIVPGTHKTLFPQPRSLSGMDAANSYDNSIVAQPGFKAGDALMFTEACRHGACLTACPTCFTRSRIRARHAWLCTLCGCISSFHRRRHHAMDGAAMGASRPADEVLSSLHGILGLGDEYCRDWRGERRAPQCPPVSSARFYCQHLVCLLVLTRGAMFRRKMILTKAGVGLGQQEWETEKPTMQWRPHLGPLLPCFPVYSCCDAVVNRVCQLCEHRCEICSLFCWRRPLVVSQMVCAARTPGPRPTRSPARSFRGDTRACGRAEGGRLTALHRDALHLTKPYEAESESHSQFSCIDALVFRQTSTDWPRRSPPVRGSSVDHVSPGNSLKIPDDTFFLE